MVDSLPPHARIEAGREAYRLWDWAGARHELEAVVAAGVSLGAEDLEVLGYASVLDGTESLEFMERAVEAHEAAGRDHDAARVAFDLARFNGGRGQFPIAMGWSRRAQRLLEGKQEGAGHAHQAILEAFFAQNAGRLGDALAASEKGYALARRHGDRDAEALSLNRRGRVQIRLGHVEDGKADLDEAMLLVRQGSTRPVPAALVYCSTIDACSDMGDYSRALQWTEAASAWIERRRICGFPGVCRLHRAELKRLRGDHEAARAETREAIALFERFHFGVNIGMAQAELGLQHLESGDLDAAEAAFSAAQGRGHEPMPGLAMLALRRGDPAGARALLEPRLHECVEDRLQRGRLLPTLVEACLALDDLPAARVAAAELTEISEAFGTVGLRASASTTAARIHLFVRDVSAAILSARAGVREWTLVGATYEISRARELLTSAYDMSGDLTRARAEREAAPAHARTLASVANVVAATIAAETEGYPDGVPPPLASDSRIRPGALIDGKIEVGRPLGAGGMGLVYAGRHRITGREVAIKVLHAELCGDRDHCARFLQEALACGKIQHPNVVNVYDAGQLGGEPYIVMERLHGEPLSGRLRRDPRLTVQEALRIAEQLASGLSAAHAAGVIHRDLKPDNVFLCSGGDNPVAKVLDFGISKLAEAAHTGAGVLLGTPLYMAPEQVRDASSADERTDIHALGTVLFEMLTGRVPYGGDGAVAVLVDIAHGVPARLSDHRTDLPRSVVEVVDRALQRDPNQRFASATELADILGQAGAGV